MYEFIRGPMAWACFSVFIAGMLFQVTRFFRMTRMKELRLMPPSPEYLRKQSSGFSRADMPALLARLRVAMPGVHPVMTLVTVLFHTSIFFLPLFLSEHNMLIEVLWGWSFCPYVLPEITVDILTGIILFSILFFLFRRIVLHHVRSISTAYDYLILVITAAPFVTGFLAIHGLFDYRTLIILHILSVNLIMIVLPFTKFVHSAFFFLNRFFIGSEYSFSKGSRSW